MQDRRQQLDFSDFVHGMISETNIVVQWRLLLDRVRPLGFDKAIYAYLPAASSAAVHEDLIWLRDCPERLGAALPGPKLCTA